MKIKKVSRLSALNRFLYWILERYQIYLKKEAGEPKPWTDDTILQSYRFCNVRRMDDKVSKWLLKSWYKPNIDHPNIVTAAVIARHFNLPECLEEIGFPNRWSPRRVEAILESRRRRGLKQFNGAYIITGTLGDGTTDNKAQQVIWKIVTPIHQNRKKLSLGGQLEALHEQLTTFKGIGSFMAGQIVGDLRWATHVKWTDRNTWAPIGPGSRRGINRLNGDPLQSKNNQFLSDLKSLIGVCETRLPEDIVRRLEAMDYQNCLCEFDKYERALWSEGRPKQKYPGC